MGYTGESWSKSPALDQTRSQFGTRWRPVQEVVFAEEGLRLARAHADAALDLHAGLQAITPTVEVFVPIQTQKVSRARLPRPVVAFAPQRAHPWEARHVGDGVAIAHQEATAAFWPHGRRAAKISVTLSDISNRTDTSVTRHKTPPTQLYADVHVRVTCLQVPFQHVAQSLNFHAKPVRPCDTHGQDS